MQGGAHVDTVGCFVECTAEEIGSGGRGGSIFWCYGGGAGGGEGGGGEGGGR